MKYRVWIETMKGTDNIRFTMPDGLDEHQKRIYAAGILFTNDFCPGETWGFEKDDSDA